MTSDEVKYRNIILITVIAGLVILLGIVIFTILFTGKNEKKVRYIRITGGVLGGTSVKLENTVSIGRDAGKCGIVYPMNEPGISANHCTVIVRGDECYLTDNSSSYGTYLENGQKLAPSAEHKIEGDKFAFYIADPKNRIEIITETEMKK